MKMPAIALESQVLSLLILIVTASVTSLSRVEKGRVSGLHCISLSQSTKFGFVLRVVNQD